MLGPNGAGCGLANMFLAAIVAAGVAGCVDFGSNITLLEPAARTAALEIPPVGTWINSEPLTFAGLRGKVVWLEFSFLH